METSMDPLNSPSTRASGNRACGSLTGEWRGHYSQYDQCHRIAATLLQEGSRISGRMSDVDTVTEQSLYDAVARAGYPPGTDEQIAERIRQQHPTGDNGPITTRSVLPKESILEGTVSGEFVRFRKRYQGESFHSFQVGDKEIGHTTPGHAVEYSGRFSVDGSTISGQWRIHEPGAARGCLKGGFELRRVLPTQDP
jgi:hypothetical protein